MRVFFSINREQGEYYICRCSSFLIKISIILKKYRYIEAGQSIIKPFISANPIIAQRRYIYVYMHMGRRITLREIEEHQSPVLSKTHSRVYMHFSHRHIYIGERRWRAGNKSSNYRETKCHPPRRADYVDDDDVWALSDKMGEYSNEISFFFSSTDELHERSAAAHVRRIEDFGEVIVFDGFEFIS